MVRAIQSRSLACSESQGHLFLDARREALHRMELVRNRKTREQGLYTFVRWNTLFTNPPLCIYPTSTHLLVTTNWSSIPTSSNTCKFLRICIAGSLWPIFLDKLSSGHYDYYVSFIRRSRRGKFTYLAEVERDRKSTRLNSSH